MTYLGHEVGRGVVRPKAANVAAILEYPAPTSREPLIRFLGMAGYYRRFCTNFAKIAQPLTNMTSGSVSLNWTTECEDSCKLKILLTQDPVLLSPDFIHQALPAPYRCKRPGSGSRTPSGERCTSSRGLPLS